MSPQYPSINKFNVDQKLTSDFKALKLIVNVRAGIAFSMFHPQARLDISRYVRHVHVLIKLFRHYNIFCNIDRKQHQSVGQDYVIEAVQSAILATLSISGFPPL